MGDLDSPLKTGFLNHEPPTHVEPMKYYEGWFEWYDGNPEDEDRSGYGVSLREGKLVRGGRAIIGVTTRVDEYNPSKQGVAMQGRVKVRASRIKGHKGRFDKHGLFCTCKLNPRGTGVLGHVSEVRIPPIYSPYMYVGKKLETPGECEIILTTKI